MTQLIPLLLILASLTVLAVQNRSISLPLVILSSETPAIPVGLLLVVAVCLGALITLILYGLMGLIRPPESKYRPIGRRVPYPDDPGSTLSSGPTGASSPSDTVYNPADAAYSSSSSAFVSDPAPPTAPNSPSNPTQDIWMPSASEPSAQPRSTINEAPHVKKKTKRTSDNPKKAKTDRKIGNDWGDYRTAEHRNSWDLSEESNTAATGSHAGQPRGLFDFIRPGSQAHASASRLASDIAAGWTGHPREQTYQTSGQPDYDSDYGGGYGGDENRDYDSGYDLDGYGRSGNYADTGLPRGPAHPRYDDLDQGWENFDHYDTPPLPSDLDERKRVYGDSLYGHDNREGVYDERAYPEDDFPEGPYPEDDFPEEPLNEMGPDGVYEADYRVIVPPSKPLDDSDNYPD